MQIFWGVHPLKSIEQGTTDDISDGALELLKAKDLIKTGDTVVLTAGIPSPHIRNRAGGGGLSNMMRIAIVD